METLLQRAKKSTSTLGKLNRRELIDLSIAWAKKEVNSKAAAAALGKPMYSSSTLYTLARGLQFAVEDGYLSVSNCKT